MVEFFDFFLQPAFIRFPQNTPFYKSMISLILKKAEKTKLLHRGLVNGLLTLFTQEPSLIQPFSQTFFELLLIKVFPFATNVRNTGDTSLKSSKPFIRPASLLSTPRNPFIRIFRDFTLASPSFTSLKPSPPLLKPSSSYLTYLN